MSFVSFFDKSTYSQMGLGSMFKSTGETIFTHEWGQAGALFDLDCINLQSSQAKELIIQLERKIQEAELLSLIIETIHKSVDINETLPFVLDETRKNLNCDRVVVYQFNSDWTGHFLAESVGSGWIPLVTHPFTIIRDDCLQEQQGGRFQQKYILVSNDIYQSGFSKCYINLLESF